MNIDKVTNTISNNLNVKSPRKVNGVQPSVV